MFWADELAAAVTGPQVVNDSKTPSGTVHVGSLRGVVLHDAIRRALVDAGTPVEFRYGVDDLDPMDAQALLTPDAVDRYMGVPLAHVPAPEGSSAPNYARHFVGSSSWARSRAWASTPELYWMSELYADGAMDPYIVRALDQAAHDPRDLPHASATSTIPTSWLPVTVICENCGRIGTTLATDWDGATVAYACQPTYVDLGRRLRLTRARVAVRRARQAALQRRLGRAAGAWSGRPSRAAARTSPPRAARATGPMPSAARSSSASRRSTCPTSS